MTIHKKILLIISSTLVVFVLSAIGYQYLGLQKRQLLLESISRDQEFFISQSLSAMHQQMSMMAKDNSAWDELVHFCNHKPDTIWAIENIGTMIHQYNLDYIWIFNKNNQLHQAFTKSKSDEITKTMTEDPVPSLFKNSPFCSYYTVINNKIVQIEGSIIVPSSDNFLHQSPAEGYFLAGRIWNQDFINKLQSSTNFDVQIIFKNTDTSTTTDTKQSKQKFIFPLIGHNGKSIAELSFTSKSNYKKEIDSFISQAFVIIFVTLIGYIVFTVLIDRIVNKPISKIINSLDKKDISIIQELKNKKDEFGVMAQLVDQFFEQQEELKANNNQLSEKNEEIEKQIKKNKAIQLTLEVVNQNLKYQTAALNDTAIVTTTDSNGMVTYVNDLFYTLSGYEESEVIGHNPRILKPEGVHSPEFYKDLWYTIAVKKTKWRGEICNKYKDGSLNWFDMTIIPFVSPDGQVFRYMSVKIDINKKKLIEKENYENNRELQFQKEQLEGIHKEITSSIEYAKNIQKALMPSDDLLDELLPRYFVLLQPKYIVSGDFYWATRDKHKIFFAVGDCTGHGVPGAFMSALGVSLLNEIVQRKEIFKPALILDELRITLKKALHQTDEDHFQRDGLDISLCAIDLNTMVLEYAGANRNLYLVRKTFEQKIYTSDFALKANVFEYDEFTLLELKGDKMPIGVSHNTDDSFSQAAIKIKKRDSFYLASDGYQDQFGGPSNKKFGSKRLRQYLVEIQKHSIIEQKQLLYDKFTSWKCSNEQTDDMLIIGLKF